MRNFFIFRRATTLAILAATTLAFIPGQAADKKTPPPKAAPKGKAPAPVAVPAAPPEEHKSVFEKARIDPFFPKSLRFAAQVTPGTDQKPLVPVEQIHVTGILLGKEKTAIINRKTLAEGESAVLKLAKGAVQVHVIEIRQRSVIIKIDPDPEPKEIYLRATP